MTQRTRVAGGALAIALGLAALGDGLFRTWPWGINVGVWLGAAILGVTGVALGTRVPLTGAGRWLTIPLLVFGLAVAWRDSPTLVALNLFAVTSCLALAVLYTRTGRLWIGGLAQHLLGSWYVGLMAAVGSLLLIVTDIEWHTLRHPRGSGAVLAVARGVVLALPPLLVFGGLLMAADAAFTGLVSQLFAWDLREVTTHVVIIGALAWIVAGLLRLLFLGDSWHDPLAREQPFIRLGAVEIGVVLGALDVLFLAFVLVQLRYFFGGAALVEATVTLTYAEYARRGFFELVYVAMFALPLLLVAHWTIPADRVAAERWFRVLAGVMIGLLIVIMVSALQRMRLYTLEFGLTELRLYPTAFMGWLALVFGWFGATVLRGRRQHFAFGALVSAFAVLLALNLANPDEIIVRANLERGITQDRRSPEERSRDPFMASFGARPERPVDDRYLGTLSADAVPALVDGLPLLSIDAQARLAARLLRAWSPPAAPDWRGTNWSRSRAWEAVAAEQQRLEPLAAQAPAPSR